MPLVYFYHLLIASVFLNTAAEDAQGLEKLANTALIPMQYFFEGKTAIPTPDGTYTFERRFDYDHHFFAKTAASTVALPFSLVIGSTLKSLSYLSPSTKERAAHIYAAAHSTNVSSNLDYYQSIGMQVEDYRDAPLIDPPRWERQAGAENQLLGDVEALQEIVRILSKHNIPFWIDCGSCLGAYQYGGAIPGDWDIDVAVLVPDFENVKNALQELDPKKFIVQDWSGRANPKTYLKVYIHETGGMIDLYHFAVDAEKTEIHTLFSNEHNIFSPTDWKEREKRYTVPMAFSTVFPLKKALFEGIEVPVPAQTEHYLQAFYGENLAPARVYSEITGNYEKDLSHPYWKTPHAH